MDDFTSATATLDPVAGVDALVHALAGDGYRVVGPTERDGVISYRELSRGTDMPTGVRTEQRAGSFRLAHDGETRFGWTPAADSWRAWVFPAEEEVLRIRRTDGSFVTTRPALPTQPLALFAARDCEVRALGILDRVLLEGAHPDPRYAARRNDAFIVAVTCTTPSESCWCTGTGGGPQPRADFDIRLTELTEGGHRLLAEAGSERGAALLQRLAAPAATGADLAAAETVVERAVAAIRRPVDAAALTMQLAGKDRDVQWEAVAERCFACGNCTLVCPTCFCVAYDDVTALTDDGGPAVETVRRQQWASCFQLDHSNLGGKPVRASVASRYRQWLTHKLQTWEAQFGTAGCVGCGRCTTWCPAGIDLPAEAALLAATTAPAQGGTQ